MNAIDRLRQVPAGDEYTWAVVALTTAQAREVVALVDQLEARVAELAAAGRRCADCGRGARQLVAVQDGDGQVVHLGPGCYRKRAATLGQREQLTIGGSR